MAATFDLITIGGGAAGFFGSIVAAGNKPGLKILILEKTPKLLSKVKVSGGGRCNVTHHCFEPTPLSDHYPRGRKELKMLFRKFQARDMVAWLESKSVILKTEADGRMFPVTDDSQTIIDCFLQEAERHRIQIKTSTEVTQVVPGPNGFVVHTPQQQFNAKRILIATGGHNNSASYGWLRALGFPIVEPLPSLFTFNDSEKHFADLMGVSVPDAEVKITSTKYLQRGPVLITHWGLSGPAVLKLSAWAAEYLHSKRYMFTVLVNWVGLSEEQLRQIFETLKQSGKQKVVTNPLFNLPLRLWQRLCVLAEIPESKIWMELPQKNFNKLMEFLIRCPFQIKGKTTFKEEFVTCGGIGLQSLDLETMECKNQKGIYVAGEVLNIDGETGGFNFQSAWTTAWVAARAIASS